jgi:hypothetical protein
LFGEVNKRDSIISNLGKTRGICGSYPGFSAELGGTVKLQECKNTLENLPFQSIITLFLSSKRPASDSSTKLKIVVIIIAITAII